MPAPAIQPNSAVMSGKEQKVFVANQDVTWSCSAGSIAYTGIYTAPNETGVFTVRATNALGQFSQATINVTAGLYFDPQISSTGATRKNVSVSEATRSRRWTIRRSPALRFYNLDFTDRPEAEWSEVCALSEKHFPERLIYWTDPFLQQKRKFWIDAKLKWSRATRLAYDYHLSLREYKVYAPGTLSVIPSAFPFVADYGCEVEQGLEYFQSDAWDWSRVSSLVAGTSKPRHELTFSARSPAEFLQAEAFWDYYFPGREFTFQVPQVGLAGEWLIDSELSWQYAQHNMIDYKFIVRKK